MIAGSSSSWRGLQRNEVSALRWTNVDAADGDGVLVTVRGGKTKQEGEKRDVRFVDGGRRPRDPGCSGAAENPEPADRFVPLPPKMVDCGSVLRPASASSST